MRRSSYISSVILIVITLVSSLAGFFVVPNQVKAAVPVDVLNPSLTTILPGNAVKQTTQTFFEWAQRFVRETLRKRLLDMMVDQIIHWIQGGGKPKFVTNWQGFVRDATNVAVGDFAKQIGAGFLCSPFSVQLQIALLPIPRFSQPYTCTLDQIVGNINAFYDNFRNGSWIAYLGSLEPQNNYFGATEIAANELENEKVYAQWAAVNEAIAGKGYLSTKSCEEAPLIQGPPAPGQLSLNGPDLDGDGIPNDIESTCVISTPGDVIGSLTAKAVGSDLDFILNAQELEAYASAIANAAINRLIITGVEGLRGLTTSNAPSGGSVPPGGGACAGLSGAALGSCLNYITSLGNNFTFAQSSLTDQINQSLTPRESAQTSLTDSLTRIQGYAASLQNLLNLFAPLICLNQTTSLANIHIELNFASTTAATLMNNKAVNQSAIDQLSTAKTTVANLHANDWAGFSTLSNQLNASGILDSTGALALRDEAQTQNQSIQDRIAQKLQQFNQNLITCRQGILQ